MKRNANDLFKKIYGRDPQNEDQIDIFIEYLTHRLSTSEKIYVLEHYDLDLLSDEDYEKRIKALMLHPIIIKRIFDDEQEDEADEIFNKCKDQEFISISYIQRNFSKGYPSAVRILDQMIERGYVEPTCTKKGHRILKP